MFIRLLIILLVVLFAVQLKSLKNSKVNSILDFVILNVWPHDNINSENTPSILLNLTFKKGLIYFKTHKTGSSTLTSILWNQLCIKQSKSCFLPPVDHPGKTWDFRKLLDMNTVKSGISTTNERAPFEVWLNHVRYNEALFKVVQKPTLLLSIARKPSLRFQSAWYWYEHSKRLNTSLSEFVAQTSLKPVAQRLSGTINSQHHFPYRTGLDATSEELTGFSLPSMGDRNYAEKMIAFNASFDRLIANIEQGGMFVLLCDRFDESLVVLGRVMQWNNTDALLYNKKKVRVGGNSGESGDGSTSMAVSSYVENLSVDQLSALDNLQHYDSMLYNTTSRLLDSYILDYNSSLFQQHLSLFRYKLSVVTEYCSHCPTSSITTGGGAKCDIPGDMHSAYIDVTTSIILNGTYYDGANRKPPVAKYNDKYATMFAILHPTMFSHRGSKDNTVSHHHYYPNNITTTEEASFSSDLLAYCTALGRDNADNVRHAWGRLRGKE